MRISFVTSMCIGVLLYGCSIYAEANSSDSKDSNYNSKTALNVKQPKRLHYKITSSVKRSNPPGKLIGASRSLSMPGQADSGTDCNTDNCGNDNPITHEVSLRYFDENNGAWEYAQLEIQRFPRVEISAPYLGCSVSVRDQWGRVGEVSCEDVHSITSIGFSSSLVTVAKDVIASIIETKKEMKHDKCVSIKANGPKNLDDDSGFSAAEEATADTYKGEISALINNNTNNYVDVMYPNGRVYSFLVSATCVSFCSKPKVMLTDPAINSSSKKEENKCVK